MAFNLIDSVKSLFGKDIVSKASITLGEDENKLQKAITAIIPAVLTGILHKAGSGEAKGVLSLSKDAARSGMASGIGNILGDNSLLAKGKDLLSGLFGNRTQEVTHTIAGYSGISTESASSLLSMAAPAALGALGQHAESTNMNETGLLSLLNSQKDTILNAIPSGLNLAGAMGLGSIGSIGSKLSGISGEVKEVPGRLKKAKTARWAIPLIILLVGGGLLWYFLSDKNKSRDISLTAGEAARADTAVITPSEFPPGPVTIKVMLPNGVQIDAYRGGIEELLVNFLNDDSKKVDKDKWFDFDNLNFETGSARITTASMDQVRNIAAILKAFPDASIKIGGYTDKIGDEKSNLKLSQARADAVMAALKDNGINKTQLAGAEGYGSQFAQVPANASDEERKKDRRIAVSVRKK